MSDPERTNVTQKNDADQDDADSTQRAGEVELLFKRLSSETKPDPEVAGQPFYEAPDGAGAIAQSIWQRLDLETVKTTVDQINKTLGSRDDLGSTNGHLEFEGVFVVRQKEKDALAAAAGSAMVREVVDLVADVEQGPSIAEDPPVAANHDRG